MVFEISPSVSSGTKASNYKTELHPLNMGYPLKGALLFGNYKEFALKFLIQNPSELGMFEVKVYLFP